MERNDAEAVLERVAEHAELNALVHIDERFGARLAAARGPLAGCTLAVKANIEVAGMPATAGTAALAGWTAAEDAPVVARLRAAGATVLGIANMHELAFGATSATSAHGAVRNPHDPRRSPGGSSGGSAAAVAAGLVTAALGTDTGGSCRIPAALCGCVGFRPTHGRYPSAGMVGLSPTRDTAGLLAGSVQMVAALDAAICAADALGAPGPVRLGVPRRPFYEDLDPALADVVEAALAALDRAGMELVELDLDDVRAHNAACAMEIVLYESVRELSVLLAARPALGIGVRDVLDGMAGDGERAALEAQLGPDAVTAERYRRALMVDRPRLQEAWARALAGVDALVLPTTPAPAPPLAESETMRHRERRVPTFETLIRNTDASSNAGLPCVSLPAGRTPDGLPVGLELVGPAGADRALLRIARTVEETL